MGSGLELTCGLHMSSWSSGRWPCPGHRGWDEMVSRVPANPKPSWSLVSNKLTWIGWHEALAGGRRWGAVKSKKGKFKPPGHCWEEKQGEMVERAPSSQPGRMELAETLSGPELRELSQLQGQWEMPLAQSRAAAGWTAHHTTLNHTEGGSHPESSCVPRGGEPQRALHHLILKAGSRRGGQSPVIPWEGRSTSPWAAQRPQPAPGLPPPHPQGGRKHRTRSAVVPGGFWPDFSQCLNIPQLAAIIGELLNNCLQWHTICTALYQLFFICFPLSQRGSISPSYPTAFPRNNLL